MSDLAFCHKIRRIRLFFDYTQAYMAEQLGLKDARNYSNLENGRVKLLAEHLPKIAAVFGLKTSQLLDNDTEAILTFLLEKRK
jgi:transcriptional regulator with XRE-family HTH domain